MLVLIYVDYYLEDYTLAWYYAYYLVSVLLPPVNSLMNPIVLLARGSVFRKPSSAGSRVSRSRVTIGVSEV